MVDRWRSRSRGVAPVGLLHAPSRKFLGSLSFADQDAVVLLEEAIAALPAREALVFRRCCLDGTDIRTVAEESGRSPSRIYADLADAKQRIRDALTS
jgi:DNA-directed RNA polymerase specialized sigma24 family protein